MDFLKFINSNAIRKYLKEIGYKFSTAEAAFIVWQSNCYSMAEKHKAWQYIIDNLPDEEKINIAVAPSYWESIKDDFNGFSGLNAYLKAYIAAEQKLAELALSDEENTVFSFETYYKGDCDTCEDNRLFTSTDELMRAINDETEDEWKDELKWIFIKKQWLGSEEKYIKLKLTPDKTVFEITSDRNVRTEFESDLYELFDCMWFKIPTLFKKGDIVYENLNGDCIYKDKGMPFVLETICYWDIDDIKEAHRRYAWGSMDMTACGYFVNDDGEVYVEIMHNYLSLEYYDEEPIGINRTLKVLSGFFKDEIDVGLLMNAYSIILNEERITHQRKYLGMTDRGLELAGLKKKINE